MAAISHYLPWVLRAGGESLQSKTSTISTIPLFSIAQLPQSKPVTWKCAQMVSIRVIKMWMNPFVFLDFCSLFSSPGFPALIILFTACFSMSFPFAVFGLMSPHSATDVMESTCLDETTLSSPTCVAGSLTVLSMEGLAGGAGARVHVWNTAELQKSTYKDQF